MRSSGTPLNYWLTLVFASTAFFQAHAATATTAVVPDDYPTLQSAMDAASGPAFDTLLVRPGVAADSLYAVNLRGITVIGLGDSASRPVIGNTVFNSPYTCTFKNLRFAGGARTVGHAYLDFIDCELDGGLTSIIDGDPRAMTLTGCLVKGALFFQSDISVSIDSCRFDGGSVGCYDDGQFGIEDCVFTGGGSSPGVGLGGSPGAVVAVIRSNRFDHRSVGIQSDVEDGSVVIQGNSFDRCGTGMALSNQFQAEGNWVTGCTGDGIAGSNPYGGGVLSHNVIGRCGGNGVSILDYDYSSIVVSGNTIYENVGAGIAIKIGRPTGGPGTYSHNIVYGNHGFGLAVDDSIGPALSCNDWFANDSGAVSGAHPAPDDLALDPEFCNPDSGDVHLMAGSPLIDAPGCGLIGALGQGCDTVSTAALVTLFTAEREADGVHLRWQLGDATRFGEIWVERADVDAGPWTRVATGETTDGGVNVGIDRSAFAEREYWYRLAARTPDAVVVTSDPVRVGASLAGRFGLTGVTPNPGSGPVRIGFALAREAAVQMDVFDLQGRHVASLAHGTLAAGAHIVEWSGRSMAPGVYLLDYRHPGGHQIRRFVRLR